MRTDVVSFALIWVENVNVVFWTMQGIHSQGICGSLVHAQQETQIVDKPQL